MADISDGYTLLRRHAAELAAFAAVARHGQISAAARALRLSQPALTQRIRGLEEALGAMLFERTHRGVTLTPAGAELLARTEAHLGALGAALVEFRRQRQEPGVLISADYAFASFWILPRLAGLRSAPEPVDISILASQQPRPGGAADPDLVIRMGWPDPVPGVETKLVGERVSAVCSPEFLRRHPPVAAPRDLLRLPLLSLSDSGAGDWFDWDGWFRSFGIAPGAAAARSRFNTYDLVIQAAVEGHGVALGWHGLVDGLLRDGRLVVALPDQAVSDRGYFLRHGRRSPSQAARRVHDRIAAMAAAGAVGDRP